MISPSVVWSDMVFYADLPVAEEPLYHSGYTCDLCATEHLSGPFYHSKKGRDACVACAMAAGVHYIAGAVCSLFVPTTTAAPVASTTMTKMTPPVICVVQSWADVISVAFGDGSIVTVVINKDEVDECFVVSSSAKNAAPAPPGREEQVSFAGACALFPLLSGVIGQYGGYRCIELGSPMSNWVISRKRTRPSRHPPVLVGHNLLQKPTPGVVESSSSRPFVFRFSNGVVHIWDPPTGVEVIREMPTTTGKSAPGIDTVRAVFKYGYAVPHWTAERSKDIAQIVHRLLVGP